MSRTYVKKEAQNLRTGEQVKYRFYKVLFTVEGKVKNNYVLIRHNRTRRAFCLFPDEHVFSSLPENKHLPPLARV